MQQRAAQLDVVDAPKRQMTNAALQQTTANHQRICIDPIRKGEVAPHRQQTQTNRTYQCGDLLPIAATTKHQQGDQGQRELAQLRDQYKHPRKRMQSA